MKTTLKDIAAYAGVSQSSVSLYLNKHPLSVNMAKTTKQRIQKAVDKFSYRPSFAARALANNKTLCIGYICGDIKSPFSSAQADALMTAASKRGYRLQIMLTEWNYEKELECLNNLLDSSVDGIAFYNRGLQPNALCCERIRKNNLPVVMLANEVADISCVTANLQAGYEEALKVLLENKHKKIVMLHDPECGIKYEAYSRACKTLGITPREINYKDPYYVGTQPLVDLGFKIAKSDYPDALVIAADFDAAFIMKGLRKGGLRIPHDISIVGTDGGVWGESLDVSLSTVCIDHETRAKAVIDELIRRISNKGSAVKRTVIPTKFINRDSVKMIKSKGEKMLPDRSQEIKVLYNLSVEELTQKSNGHLKVTETLDELYSYLAEEMIKEFKAAANASKAFIMPVGPTQPYKIMAERINKERISLKNCWFFFMDEYCDNDDNLIPVTHPLSFRGQIGPLFFDLVDEELLMPECQRVFPTPEILADIPKMIEKIGGIDICYGGIGIHGHVAFNEPEPGIKDTDPRILTINEFTRTIDATRHGLGGNLINFPKRAITLGMKQCLGARKLLLMTRNEHEGMDWANTVLRIAALGAPGDDYPVTYVRNHPNYVIATDIKTAAAPSIII
jgi:glucosamine-6-phosphate deaminase